MRGGGVRQTVRLVTVGRVNPRARRVRGGRVRHSGSAEESEEDFEGWESEEEGEANEG